GRADFVLRWMTPVSEVELCGHATLSAAHVLWEHLGWSREAVVFSSKSGPLTVRRDGDQYELDFPALPLEPIADSGRLSAALGTAPAEVYSGMHWVCVYDSIEQIENLSPDLSKLKDIEGIRAVGVTAPGRSHDFVSRLFAPRLGIDEDPVTGSLHSLIAPYWAKSLGRDSLSARQISQRGGDLRCVVEGDRVRIAGRAVTYLEGTIHVNR
ncbi:MAG: PhzF family phenazine biosynthesis protein, partial [Planctomycetota bacterium]